MKAFSLILLCVVVAVQSRSAVVEAPRWSEAESGENPWVVHIRVAIWTSGLLNSCVGSVINERWVLTSARCVDNARFLWVRFNAVNVFQPELVLEVSQVATLVTTHPGFNSDTGANDIALINLNRNVDFTSSIRAVGIASAPGLVNSGTLCGYGQEAGGAGENLRCLSMDIYAISDGGTLAGSSPDGVPTNFDIGAPLVEDGTQVGILSFIGEGESSIFISPALYRDWIRETTGVDV